MSSQDIILCRTCKKPLPKGRQTPTFPFCCRKCKMVDLGRWFTGEYRIRETFPTEDLDELDEAEFDEE